MGYKAGEVDAFYPNYEATPLFEHARCFEGVVHAGDMIFYPQDYWHQTENLETPSMSISGTIIDEHNFREVTQELKNECAFQKFKWHFSKELCAALENCYAFWEERYSTTLDRGTCGLQR